VKTIRYPNVVRAAASRPWAILEPTLEAIFEFIEVNADGGKFDPDEVQARIAGGPGSASGTMMAGSVAVIPIYGVISPRASLFGDVSGGTSVESLRNEFLSAVRDSDVSAIAFDVNSPGGTVDLVPELAADIREARGAKPIVAIANTMMGSAAYWLGAQADRIYVTPSGDVGSIGVFGKHVDTSAAQEKAGIKTTLISAGKYKTEGNDVEPLGDEARAAMQSRVDDAYDQFIADVAAGRDVAESAVRSGYGEGRLLNAKRARAAGMVDGVQTFEATIASLMAAPDAAGAVGSFADSVDEALRAFDDVLGSAEALRALSRTKQEQLATLLERGRQLLAIEPQHENGDTVDLDAEATLANTRARLLLNRGG